MSKQKEFPLTVVRNSRMNLGEVYFWTDTIKDWKHLLKKDAYKVVITDQLRCLTKNNKIKVYGFVIMPNHLHFIWEMIELNGKEMPHASFNKWTSKNFLDDLRQNHPQVILILLKSLLKGNIVFGKEMPLQLLWIRKRNLSKS